MQIQNYNDFIKGLLAAGFSMSGGNSEGILSLISWNWNEAPPYPTAVHWHTGDAETDPWEWRIRVLDERDDIAYGKLFFNKGGFITKDWYPYFLAARRSGSFEEAYFDGKISQFAKRAYNAIKENGVLPLHAISGVAGFDKLDKPKMERALIELQTKMYITICGRQQRVSHTGMEYGWSSTAFCPLKIFLAKRFLTKRRNSQKRPHSIVFRNRFEN